MWLLELLPCWWNTNTVFLETWCLDWMCRVWMWAMSTIHESPWILHRIINMFSIYSMTCHQNLCQPPSMKLKLIEVFFSGGRLGRIIFTILWKTSPLRSQMFLPEISSNFFGRWLPALVMHNHNLWCNWNLLFFWGSPYYLLTAFRACS